MLNCFNLNIKLFCCNSSKAFEISKKTHFYCFFFGICDKLNLKKNCKEARYFLIVWKCFQNRSINFCTNLNIGSLFNKRGQQLLFKPSVKINESWYIAPSVVSGSVKNNFLIDCVNICFSQLIVNTFSQYFFNRFKNVGLHHTVFIMIH